VLEHKGEVLNQHLKEKLVYNYLELRDPTKLENRLQDQDQSICDGKVTEEESSNAINNMISNKAPGLDGLTVEFFREFWGKVNFFLIDVLNKSMNLFLIYPVWSLFTIFSKTFFKRCART
jgi:hypothetical protein